MSRAINVSASVTDIEALCQKHGIAISTIEAIPAGGTRVVLLNPLGAERVRELMKAKLITAPIVRSSLHLARQPRSASR